MKPRDILMSGNKSDLISGLAQMVKHGVIKEFHQAKDPDTDTVRWVIADNDGETLYFKTNEARALVKGAMLRKTK